MAKRSVASSSRTPVASGASSTSIGVAAGAQRITLAELASRRQRVLEALGGAVGLVLAGEHAASLHGRFVAHAHFRYLTGIDDEPGAMLLLDPSNPDAQRREMLFLKPLNPELEQWDGLREPIGAALKAGTGFGSIARTTALGRWLTPAARRSRRLALLHPIASHDQPVSPDLAIFRLIAERLPGCAIADQSELVAGLRSVKSDAEVALIERAGRATGVGFEAAARAIQPGVSERLVQSALEDGFVRGGGRGLAYESIVGGGVNGTVLHYKANTADLREGDLLVIDAAASFGGYNADVTRTFPVSGRFSQRQREIYSTVLRAQEAAIRACKPGVWLHDVDAAARKVIADAGFGDAFMHGIGHHLGIETHDVTPSSPLQAGCVITIEPGIYLKDEALGVRIEDDVVITERGCRNLTDHIPKSVEAVEAMMAGIGGRP